MNEITVFNNPEFGSVRTIEVDGEIYFVGKDVAEILGYGNTRDALTVHVDDEDKVILQKSEIATFDIPNRGLTLINESGLYSLILSSKLPSAKKFKRWVTSEVLPEIRKTGSYNKPQTYIEALEELLIQAKEKEKLLADNEMMKPKAEFYDAVAGSKTAIEMAAVAKVLNFKGVGRNKLFEILREENVLQRDNTPYQKYIDMGWFRLIEQKYSKDGEICINIKTLVYQKGIDGIRKLLEKNF